MVFPTAGEAMPGYQYPTGEQSKPLKHKSKFWGWICSRCNLALGLVKDNIETLKAMIEYLFKNG